MESTRRLANTDIKVFPLVIGGLMAAKKSNPSSNDMPKRADKKWHWADPVIKGDKVIVSSPKVGRPARLAVQDRQVAPALPAPQKNKEKHKKQKKVLDKRGT